MAERSDAPPATVWGINVCDDERYFLDKVAADAQDWRQRYAGVPDISPDTIITPILPSR